MARALLITQCLQRDFVGPVDAHAPLPNKLHVGRPEAMRLLGPNPEHGPVAQLMQWARLQDPSALEVVHIRDWHDETDRNQADHLATFGAHCLAESEGAGLVLDLDAGVHARSNERFVNAVALNDFEDTDLQAQIQSIVAASDEPLRVGVVGVWTEAKVSYVLYDLKTRCRLENLGTCSALTASASRNQHFNALGQLERLLGVQIHDTVGAFTQWLLPDGDRLRAEHVRPTFVPKIEVHGTPLEAADEDLVSVLFRESAAVELKPLGGGFSGARVFAASSRDAVGHAQAPSVLKVGDRALIGKERVRFERVESILGNDAPTVRGFVDLGQRAGIKYAYAAMGQGGVRTFKELYEGGAPLETVEHILETVFSDVLGRFYDAAQYERLPLLEHYGFAPRFAESVRRNVAAMGASDEADGRRLVAFYARDLVELASSSSEYRYVSYVHGDLNGANILLDGRDNVWLIDFFHTDRGHALKDLIKLENDLLYIFTAIDDGARLTQARALTDALLEVEDLRAELPRELDGVTDPGLQRTWTVLRMIRGHVGRLCRDDRNPLQMSVGLLRYAAHTLSFDESSPLQKRWALYAAARHAEHIATRGERNRQLRVDWIEASVVDAPGRLGLTLCPGRRDRHRDLQEDLDALVSSGARHLVSLLTEDDLEWAGVPDLRARSPIPVRRLPVRDQEAPPLAPARREVAWILDRLTHGEDVVVHCMGGLGRSGALAAAVLVEGGVDPEEAIAAVRRARGPRAIETPAQEEFVRDYAGASR